MRTTRIKITAIHRDIPAKMYLQGRTEYTKQII